MPLDSAPPNAIQQYIPAYVDTGGERHPIVEFASLDKMLEIPFVAHWAARDGFHQFSISGLHLMAELKGGRDWRVVGALRHPIDGLPEWDGGIYEVWNEAGEAVEIPGSEVESSCGVDVFLRDGRRLLQRREGETAQHTAVIQSRIPDTVIYE